MCVFGLVVVMKLLVVFFFVNIVLCFCFKQFKLLIVFENYGLLYKVVEEIVILQFGVIKVLCEIEDIFGMLLFEW